MNSYLALLQAANTPPASTWDNPHEVAQWLFGSAAVAFIAAGVLFGGNENLRKTVPALVPGVFFCLAGMVIYLFG